MHPSPSPFAELFRESVRITKMLWKPLILGTLLFLALMLLLVVLVVTGMTLTGVASLPEGALPTLPMLLTNMGIVFLFVILMVFVSWGMATYTQLLAVERHHTTLSALRRVPSLMMPLGYVWLWMFLRMYLWVPALIIVLSLLLSRGNELFTAMMTLLCALAIFVLSIVFAPRVLFAPVILIEEKVRPLESVKRSEARTKGYWGKVTGNWLLLMVVLWFFSFGMQTLAGGTYEWLAALFLGESALGVKVLSVVVGLVLGVAYMFVYTLMNFVPPVFVAQLHRTLKDHPAS